jgi:multidrug efflux pump subunit AcrA (membrane-fusion protein)
VQSVLVLIELRASVLLAAALYLRHTALHCVIAIVWHPRVTEVYVVSNASAEAAAAEAQRVAQEQAAAAKRVADATAAESKRIADAAADEARRQADAAKRALEDAGRKMDPRRWF